MKLVIDMSNCNDWYVKRIVSILRFDYGLNVKVEEE